MINTMSRKCTKHFGTSGNNPGCPHSPARPGGAGHAQVGVHRAPVPRGDAHLPCTAAWTEPQVTTADTGRLAPRELSLPGSEGRRRAGGRVTEARSRGCAARPGACGGRKDWEAASTKTAKFADVFSLI